MSKKIEQQNLRRLSIRERHQVKEQFFRLYRKTDNVTQSARALDICRRTATRWVRASKLNGGRVRHEGRHGRRKGDGRALTRRQERKLLSMIVDKTPMQHKFPFALWNAKAIRELIRAEFGVEVSRHHHGGGERPEAHAHPQQGLHPHQQALPAPHQNQARRQARGNPPPHAIHVMPLPRVIVSLSAFLLRPGMPCPPQPPRRGGRGGAFRDKVRKMGNWTKKMSK